MNTINTTRTLKERRDAPTGGAAALRGAGPLAEVYLPVHESNPGDDVLEVCLNGRNTLIRRGVRVTVPLSLAEVIRHSGAYATIRRVRGDAR
jgi:hypothetical protein